MSGEAAETDIRGATPGPAEVQRVFSGGPYEERFGYCRAVRVGPFATTAGCTAVVGGVVAHAGDAGAQAEVAFGVGLAALADLGLGPESVVATRMYVVSASDSEAVGAAHGRIFGSSRPAATMVVVAGLIDPAMLVEVELTAWGG
jgi:enamine deaminase RidA (YjgF/YER057c/UK114 family)